ncbi:hypothetical protein A2U01_0079778, partial [Trifolium medium]|nr:hypothetical protein [Trifolium medium]
VLFLRAAQQDWRVAPEQSMRNGTFGQLRAAQE